VAGALARAGAEMMSALSTPLLLERVCQLANALLACDACDTVLRSPDGEVWIPHAGHGYSADEWESLRILRIPNAGVESLVDALRERGAVEVQTAGIAEPLARKLLEQYGITASLYVPLHRGDEIVGFLAASYRARDARFGAVEHRVARGIGQLASMALENARLVEELRSASHLKSEFVSTMSHELRTPLSVIIGYTDILADDPDADERQRILGRIRLASRELLELVESTLNLNRLEAGKDPVRLEPVPIDALFDELAGEFAAVPRSADVELHWSADAGLAAWADRRKLRIIVKNLVGNALKFTAAGSVRVTCRRAPGHCVFAVQDTGVGIAPEHLPVIFDMFRQADSSDARSYGGVGLGLYIVRRMLGVLGGDIEVASAPGQGTTFTFTVPSADAETSLAGTAS
jgi:signal transduction histidine kinase